MIVVATILIVTGGVYSLFQMRAVSEHLQKNREYLRERDKHVQAALDDLHVKLDLILRRLPEARPAK
jgi:prefoldin subunit 5